MKSIVDFCDWSDFYVGVRFGGFLEVVVGVSEFLNFFFIFGE